MSGNRKQGALPVQLIRELITGGYIQGAEMDNVRPASLDLSLSDEIYRVEGIFQPRPGETVRQVLKLIKKDRHDISEPLKRGQMYMVRLNETINLPHSIYAFCNPKSTSGRLDLHVRLMADQVSRYDSLPAGWPNSNDHSGQLWVSIVPKTFSVKLTQGLTLNQVRFFNADTRLDNLELALAMRNHKLLWPPTQDKPLLFSDLSVQDNDGSLVLTIDGRERLVGFRSRFSQRVIDLSRKDYYKPDQFFEPVHKKGRNIYLQKDRFYILSTREAVRVPPDLACEMMPMDERSGEFRSHYAGFIDPGWGWEEGKGRGRPLTLEIRPFEDIIARDGQPIAKVRFERITESPTIDYDSLASNYLNQKKVKLAKQFQEPAW